MTLDVKFEEQDQTFNTNFGEIQTVSDGGFERGYNEGYAQGEVEGYDKGKTDGRVEGEQVGFDNAVSKLTTLEVTENGEYTPSDDNIGFDKVTVNVGGEEKSKLAQRVDGTLTEVTANDLKGITEISYSAFYGCSSLINVEIPQSVTKIGDSAFQACYNLVNVNIPQSVTELGSSVFYACRKLVPILHDKLTFIGVNCFFSCNSIEHIEIPNSVTSLGQNVFQSCKGLLSAKIPSSITKLPSRMFSTCTSLTTVEIPNSVTRIDDYVFYECSSLENLTIPSSVTKIGYGGVSCGSLSNKSTITFLGTTPPTIVSNTFNKNFLNKIIVPKGCGDVYKSATNWSNFADYIEEATE